MIPKSCRLFGDHANIVMETMSDRTWCDHGLGALLPETKRRPAGIDARTARRTAVLSDGAFAVPLSAGPAGAQGLHPFDRPPRRGAERSAHPIGVPAFADHRLPACLRKLPRLRVGPHQGG